MRPCTRRSALSGGTGTENHPTEAELIVPPVLEVRLAVKDM